MPPQCGAQLTAGVAEQILPAGTLPLVVIQTCMRSWQCTVHAQQHAPSVGSVRPRTAWRRQA